jgi:hypothetical protein
MVDLLRMINPIPEEQKETNESILSTNLNEDSTIENRYQQGNQFIDAENILIKNEMSTTAAPLSSLSIDRTAGSSLLIRGLLFHTFIFNDKHNVEKKKEREREKKNRERSGKNRTLMIEIY